MPNKIIVIGGATASGKTALAVDIAKQLNTEVISADSMLIYEGLDKGTAKPTIDEMQGVKHHLIDICNIKDSFSVSDYEEKALPIIDKLFQENKMPIICGGTGLYIKSILFEQNYGGVQRNDETREKYQKILEEKGNTYLHNLLRQVDKESAEKLHPNDTGRVIRALEIYDLTGNTKSSYKQEIEKRFDYKMFAIDYPREILYERINKRVDIMIKNGLVEEVQSLIDKGLNENNQCLQGIGYKEVYDYLCGKTNFEDMVSLIKQNTRHYAKKQITLFKRIPDIIWLKKEEADFEHIQKYL